MKIKLTPQEQIEILKVIDFKAMEEEKEGLCHRIGIELYKNINIFIPIYKLHETFPLFTFENSKKFSSYYIMNKMNYWFELSKQGYKERKAFVDWMISELEKEDRPSLFKRIINKFK